MTALNKYQRLECGGLWRDHPDAQRREVVVSFGDTSLVLKDPRSDVPLAHWSLPAILRENPGHLPAIYTPGDDATESLELSDPDMIAALETVHRAVVQALPKPGRLRLYILLGLSTAIAAGAVFWLPGALRNHTASVVPATARADIGLAALDDLSRLTGGPCANRPGQVVLAGLSERLFGPQDTPILLVMRDAVTQPMHLPGGIILLPQSLLQTSAEAIAGAALAEAERAVQSDPLLPVLERAGLRATLALFTTGALPDTALAGYGEGFLRTPITPLADDLLLARMKGAGVPSTPFAYAQDATGTATLGLIEADPFRAQAPPPQPPSGNRGARCVLPDGSTL
jgi:hypothetical protein